MSDKAQAKYAQLWAAYVQARALRRDCLSQDLPATAEAFAALDLAAEDGLVEAHLAALSAERKALKRLAKHARKHGSDVLPAALEPAVPAAPPAAKAPRRQPQAKAAAVFKTAPVSKTAPVTKPGKVASRPKVRPVGSAPAATEVPAAPPARPRRPRAPGKAAGPRGVPSSKA